MTVTLKHTGDHALWSTTYQAEVRTMNWGPAHCHIKPPMIDIVFGVDAGENARPRI